MSTFDREGWDLFFLYLTKSYALRSKDPSTKTGTTITDGFKNPICFGFNGFPVGDPDDPEEYRDRDAKYKKIVHAEVNAINKLDISDNSVTLYNYPYLPCTDCADYIIGYNSICESIPYHDMKEPRISRVVATDYYPKRWKESFEEGRDKLLYAGVKVDTYEIHKVSEPYFTR